MAVWSVVKALELEGATRLDAEYYQGIFFKNRKALRGFRRKTLAEISKVITNGATPYSEDLTQGEIRFLTAEHVYDLHIDYSSSKFIRRVFHEGSLKRTALRENDLLVTIKGKVGNPAVVFDLDKPTNINQDVARIVLDETCNPFYVATFMASRFGRLQSQQLATNQINPFLGLGNLRQIEIPEAPGKLESEVASLMRKGQAQHRLSESLYLKAERVVLDEIGWDKLSLSQSKWWAVPLSRADGVHRLDAEHFQPKYDRLVAHLQKVGKAKQIGEFAPFIKRGLQPDYAEDGEILVVNSQHLGRFMVNVEATERADAKFLDDNKRCRLQRNDVLLYATGAYVGRTNVWLEDRKAVASNHVTIIRPDKSCNPAYLAVFLNASCGIFQADRWASGSAQREIYPEDIGRIWVALPSDKAQEQVANLVQESCTARQKAKALLEEAKVKVETLIEKGGGRT